MSGNGNFVTVPRVLLWPCNEIFQQSKREILVDGRLLKKFFSRVDKRVNHNYYIFPTI